MFNKYIYDKDSNMLKIVKRKNILFDIKIKGWFLLKIYDKNYILIINIWGGKKIKYNVYFIYGCNLIDDVV